MSSTGSLSGANKKKSTKDVQEEITNLYNNIRLFEKGTKLFSGNFFILLYFLPKLIILSYFTSHHVPISLIILFTFDKILNSSFDPPKFVNIIKFRNQILLNYSLHLCFPDADETQVLLSKHILKTLCTDVTNILFNFLAGDLMMSAENPSTISSEVRQLPITLKPVHMGYFYIFVMLSQVRVKILSKLPEETRGPLLKLHSCLNSKVSFHLLTSTS